jgi:hypothetical protein
MPRGGKFTKGYFGSRPNRRRRSKLFTDPDMYMVRLETRDTAIRKARREIYNRENFRLFKGASEKCAKLKLRKAQRVRLALKIGVPSILVLALLVLMLLAL